MNKVAGSLKVYSALLRLYPRDHRSRYGEQMLQTVADMLEGASSTTERIKVWARIITDLPLSLYKEHVQSIGDKMQIANNPQRTSLISTLVLVAISVLIVVTNRMLVYQGPPFEGLPRPFMFIAVIIMPLVILGISIAAVRSIKQRGGMTLRRVWPFVVLACIAGAYFTIGLLDYIRAWRHGLFPM